tara:strand:+ start:377 stop:640 length:264 start_codon:yes stop_codon:yes gene_type:complete
LLLRLAKGKPIRQYENTCKYYAMQELKKAICIALLGMPFVFLSSRLATDLRSLDYVYETNSSPQIAIPTSGRETTTSLYANYPISHD